MIVQVGEVLMPICSGVQLISVGYAGTKPARPCSHQSQRPAGIPSPLTSSSATIAAGFDAQALHQIDELAGMLDQANRLIFEILQHSARTPVRLHNPPQAVVF